MSAYTYEAMLARAKAEIERDIHNGDVPFLVASFAELHDYCDANCYGGFCDDAAPSPEILGGVLNRVQSELDAWLRGRASDLTAQIQADVDLPPPVISVCSVCGAPAHASETDDLDRCASCRPRKFLVATFDVTDLTPAEIGSLTMCVEAQAEGDDGANDYNYPAVKVVVVVGAVQK